jgi:hypothetical protein
MQIPAIDRNLAAWSDYHMIVGVFVADDWLAATPAIFAALQLTAQADGDLMDMKLPSR